MRIFDNDNNNSIDNNNNRSKRLTKIQGMGGKR